MTTREHPAQARRYAAAAIVGVLAYVLIDAGLRLLEPQYSLLRNAESDYGNGAFAWLMDFDFLLRGVASAAVVMALAAVVRPMGPIRLGSGLLVVWAVAPILLGLAVAGLVALPLVGRPPLRGDFGLFERLFLGIELAWLLVAAAWVRRMAGTAPPARE